MLKKRVKRLFVDHPRLGVWGLKLIRPLFAHHPSIHEPKIFLEQVKWRGFHPETILDVGAHLGEWSRMAKSVFPKAEVILVEPQAEMQPFLDRFCARFPGSRWFQVGAGAEAGERTLFVSNDPAASSFLPSSEAPGGEKRVLEVQTINRIIGQHNLRVPDLIKIDVQGGEIEVLDGASACFGSTTVFVVEASLFEFHAGQPIFHEIVYYMAERGYVTYDLVNLNRRPLDGALGQVDICFAKEDSKLRSNSRWE